MLKIYGSPLCKDCVICKAELEKAGVEFLYLDITGNLLFLKQFLKLRERSEFDTVREKGQIGIPAGRCHTDNTRHNTDAQHQCNDFQILLFLHGRSSDSSNYIWKVSKYFCFLYHETG